MHEQRPRKAAWDSGRPDRQERLPPHALACERQQHRGKPVFFPRAWQACKKSSFARSGPDVVIITSCLCACRASEGDRPPFETCASRAGRRSSEVQQAPDAARVHRPRSLTVSLRSRLQRAGHAPQVSLQWTRLLGSLLQVTVTDLQEAKSECDSSALACARPGHGH